MNNRRINNNVLLLQSGGRDSTAAAVSLLEEGHSVTGITLSADAENRIHLPRTRAIELKEKYKDYRWAMMDFTEWDSSFKRSVSDKFNDELPKSCLLCAISKLTAIIPFCKGLNIKKIAMGYTNYQSSWAEQTPYAIELQQAYLKNLDIDLVLPVQLLESKSQASSILMSRDLTPSPLENPCCIAFWGTHDVPENMISDAIRFGFEYFEKNNPKIELVSSVGEF